MTSPDTPTSPSDWAWKAYGKDLVTYVAKELWEGFCWHIAAEKYRQQIIRRYGTTQIFGQPRPVPLEDIFTDVYILERPEAFRRFDIRQLRADPDRLDEHTRIHGRTLLRQSEAYRLLTPPTQK